MAHRGNLRPIARLIKMLREERGMSQSAFAKQLSTTQSAIARIENGEQNLSAATLSRISRVLGRDVVSVGTGALNVEIEGGRRLFGTVTTKSSKNGAVGLLCASLLNAETTTLKNVPRIEEVRRVIEVLESIGAAIRWSGNDVEIRPPKSFRMERLNAAAAVKTRSAIMLMGPLIHALPRFRIPHPGGCRLGSRTITPHLFALEAFGVRIRTRAKEYEVSRKSLKSAEVVLYESGDTVTENALMAAAKIPGTSVIKFASANYQVQELCFFLQKLGVGIDGVGTTTLTVRGVSEIAIPTTYWLSEDPIESMFFIAAAIVTRSGIRINRCPIEFLELELLKLQKMGFRYKILRRYTSFNNHTILADIRTYPSRLIALPDKIEARPYPGLNIDNLPFFAVIATQARGQTLIHDWVYDGRAAHYKELDKLGAEILLADPHRAFVNGPTKLRAAEVICPPALRPAAIVLIGMLGAEGRSVLRNIYSINRGYEDLIARLSEIGAKVKILREF